MAGSVENIQIHTEAGIHLPESTREAVAKYGLEKGKKVAYTFTKQELDDLQKLLQDIPQNEQKIKDFLKQQERETITTTEILTGTSLAEKLGGVENVKVFTEISSEASYNHFFGAEGIFSGLNISEDAKRNFATGANVFFMEYIASLLEKKSKQTESIDESDIFSLLKNSTNIGETISAIEGFVKGDVGKTISQAYNKENEQVLKKFFASKTDLQAEHPVFMNPYEAYNFLVFSYHQKRNESELSSYVNKKASVSSELSPQNQKELQEAATKLGNYIPKELGASLSTLQGIKQTLEKLPETIMSGITENKDMMAKVGTLLSIPFLGDILRGIFEFFGIKDIDKMLEGSKFAESKEIISEKIHQKGSMFAGKNIGEDFMKTSDGKDDFTFVENIRSLIPDSDDKEKFEKGVGELFATNSQFSDFLKKIPDISLTKGDEILYSELQKGVLLYREFNEKKAKDKNYTVEKFFVERKSETQKNDAEVAAILGATGATVSTADLQPEAQQPEAQQPEAQQPEAQQPEAQQPEREVIITAPEGLEISASKIRGVFEIGGKKYQLQVLATSDGDVLMIEGNGQAKVFSGGTGIKSYLAKFSGKLSEKARGSHFGQTDIELNGHTIQDILMNGLHEKVGIGFISKQVDKDGLKDIVANNFIENGNIRGGTIQISFNDKNYSFQEKTAV